MKKIAALILVCLMAASLLAGCGAADSAAPGGDSAEQGAESADIGALRTMGDVFGFEDCGVGYGEGSFVYVFEADGTYYRAIADLPEDVSEALWALDFFDEQHDEKVKEIVAPLEISRLENLSETILPQEELDALIGRTGQELLDDDWYIRGYNLDTMEFWMYHGAFAYTVVFDGTLELTDDFNEEEAIGPLTVKSVTFDGIGDATDPE